MFRHIVEGWSQDSYEDAIFSALRKASDFLGATHDVHIFIRELSHNEEQGYHAVLELSKEPMSVRLNLDMEDDPAHRGRIDLDRRFRILRRREHDHMGHIVAAHFEKIGKPPPPSPVPDFILAGMTDVSVENDEVEAAFDHACHPRPDHTEPVPAPRPRRDDGPEPE